MKIAIVTLPQNTLGFNLHGHWTPPECVLEFWYSGCKIEFISDADYDSKKIQILNSYNTFLKNYYVAESGTIQNTDVQS